MAICKENDNYIIKYREVGGDGSGEIIVKSKRGAGYSASHKEYFEVDGNGRVLQEKKINADIAEELVNNIIRRGDTEGFYLNVNNVECPNACHQERLKDVKHRHSQKETNFTSTGEKLKYHYPVFEKLKDTGYGSIIRATMTLHQLCSSRCHYCSTISRNKRDSISLLEAKEFIRKLYFDQAEYNRLNFTKYNEQYKRLTGSDIRLRGLILSGGGQPNLWPHFVEFVEWLACETDIELGLITNGFPENIPDYIYDYFKWVRISITPEDASPHYVNNKFNDQYIPDNLKNNDDVALGFSYVYGPWTNDDVLCRISDIIKETGADYCRMLTDCNLTRGLQIESHNVLAERLISLGLIEEDGTPHNKIFHQLKYHGSKDEAMEIFEDGLCYLQSYNTFWDTTGHEENKESYCYACDSITVLSENINNNVMPSERKFNSDIWGTLKNTEVNKLYEEPVQPFFDPRSVCASCLFMRNNREVRKLIDFDYCNSLEVANDVRHKNFP